MADRRPRLDAPLEQDGVDLSAALVAGEAAIAAAERVFIADELARPSGRVAGARIRVGFLGDTVVVALAGGTGSGKSSLLNALAGEEVTRAGVLRPTTAHALAWVPDPAEPSLIRLLDHLDIRERVGQQRLPRLAVIDLPDFDSVARAHRERVNALVPRVDAVIWVLDPEKYNDAAIHVDYLRPLAHYAEQFLFVLNQADRLRPDERDEVVTDLRNSLIADGLDGPDVLATAADPAEGDPFGIDDLLQVLDRRLQDKALVLRKLLIDLREASATLDDLADDAVGAQPAPPLDDESTLAPIGALVAAGIVDDLAIEQAERVGGRTAARAGAGPVGRVGALVATSRLGRAIGIDRSEPVETGLLTSPADSGADLDAVVALHDAVSARASSLPEVIGRRLRGAIAGRAIEDGVRTVSRVVRAEVAAPTAVPTRWWWTAAAVLQTVLGVAVAVGAFQWFADPLSVRPGREPWPAVLVFAGLLLGRLLAAAVRASGRRAGAAIARRHRTSLAARATSELRMRFGAPLEEHVNDWESFQSARLAFGAALR